MLIEVAREPLSTEAEVMLDKFFEELVEAQEQTIKSDAPVGNVLILLKMLSERSFLLVVKEALRKAYRCGRAHERHETEKSADKKLIELLDDYNHERNRLWEDLRQKAKRHG
jgi:hypothetical protein